ncbi:hypothetical protein HYC85_015158 [Camellia sinensis]|uniref:Uncharacterized protein n=1 Tax=Camellia sinensis TaxID=4442 RepID=A0A7J7HAE2_CAMSI|nr:hypothetical protein HYC85_015158 [Camellia sinensis]
MKFGNDGVYFEKSERKGDLLIDKPEDGNSNILFVANGSLEPISLSPNLDSLPENKRRGRSSISRKSVSLDHIMHLLSSSMDKTVRLWHLSGKSCLKISVHIMSQKKHILLIALVDLLANYLIVVWICLDTVTCIQFNPVDDRYFISGSLDAKVYIWSIPDRQVVDWNDLHEMVIVACYTPDGQGALVGSYKGSCRLYNTSENKLQQKTQINLQNKKKKSHQKNITGFQEIDLSILCTSADMFAPGSSSEVHITSADSQIRVIDGVDRRSSESDLFVHRSSESDLFVQSGSSPALLSGSSSDRWTGFRHVTHHKTYGSD